MILNLPNLSDRDLLDLDLCNLDLWDLDLCDPDLGTPDQTLPVKHRVANEVFLCDVLLEQAIYEDGERGEGDIVEHEEIPVE